MSVSLDFLVQHVIRKEFQGQESPAAGPSVNVHRVNNLVLRHNQSQHLEIIEKIMADKSAVKMHDDGATVTRNVEQTLADLTCSLSLQDISSAVGHSCNCTKNARRIVYPNRRG